MDKSLTEAEQAHVVALQPQLQEAANLFSRLYEKFTLSKGVWSALYAALRESFVGVALSPVAMELKPLNQHPSFDFN